MEVKKMKEIYVCDICEGVSYDSDEVKQCEKTHEVLSKQCHIVADEIAKFQEMGGRLEMYFGSADAKELGNVIYSKESNRLTFKTEEQGEEDYRTGIDQLGEGANKLMFKNWTIESFKKILKKLS